MAWSESDMGEFRSVFNIHIILGIIVGYKDPDVFD